MKTNSSWFSHFPCSDLLTPVFHGVHVLPLCRLTMQLRKSCQDKDQTFRLAFTSASKFETQKHSILNPRKDSSVLNKAVDLLKGITAPGVFQPSSAMSLWLVSAASTCHFQTVGGQICSHPMVIQTHNTVSKLLL